MTQTFKCPHCNKTVEISQALAHELQEKIMAETEAKHKTELQKVKAETELSIKKSLEEKQALEFEDLKRQLAEQQKKNDEFMQKELELREERRRIEQEKKDFELKMRRAMDEKEKELEEKILKDEQEKSRLREKEKDMQIENLKRMLDDAQRKASQASQQIQGEVLELDLEEKLKEQFPTDLIEPVGKGRTGGDIVQTVRNSQGKTAGSILWETKRAEWRPVWISKLREDTRSVGASAAILVSEVLPKGTDGFGFIEGILVTSYPYMLSLATLIRRGIMQTAAAKAAAESKDGTLELIYQYLQSDAFRHRIEGYIDGVREMRSDLESERRSMERIWKKREMQISKAELNISHMYGELQGIMGKNLPDIKPLSLDSGE